MKRIRIVLVMLLIAVSIFSAITTTSAQDKPFKDVTVEVLTFVGPQVAEPLYRRAPDFEALTGAKINITTVPFADLYQSILTDQASGTNSYDAFLLAPQWMADFVTPGYFEDLTDYVAKDKAIEWDDIAPFFRNFISSYAGRVYTIPVDGDFHMVYYRTDVLKDAGLEAPKTWEDYLKVAEALNGKDMDGDGKGDYGSCIAKVRGGQGFWWIISIAGAYLQNEGTAQGAFFDTETLKPLTKTEGFIRALQIYKETTKYGPPDELNLNLGDVRSLFISGRCALTMDWGDIGSLSVDPQQSKVKDKVGTLILPGSTQVVDRTTGKLVACDAKTCPHAVDGVNYAPFASFGGWGGSVSAAADPKVKEAAYAFFSYIAQPAQANEDVTIGKTGYNPYRISQFENLDPWLKSGFSETSAKDYLSAIKASLESPNMILDLGIPQNQRYEQVVLDTVISQFLAGEFTAEEAGTEIYNQWEELTDEIGREGQMKAYQSLLGISTK